MDPKLAAKLAARRRMLEPETVTAVSAEPCDTLSDEALLTKFQAAEREKASAILARVCNSMLLVSENEFPDVYPLQDDSRFFMQALLDELDDIKQRKPAVALEVGCGAAPSGVLLSRLLPDTAVLGTDLSISAMGAAARNARDNKADLQLARMDLLSALRPNTVDLAVFLPPYVPTTEEKLAAASKAAMSGAAAEVAQNVLDATWLWAGGPNGTAGESALHSASFLLSPLVHRIAHRSYPTAVASALLCCPPSLRPLYCSLLFSLI